MVEEGGEGMVEEGGETMEGGEPVAAEGGEEEKMLEEGGEMAAEGEALGEGELGEGELGEEAEGEEGEEEEEEFNYTDVDVGVGGMLLGSVAFVMLLFYFVNWQDDDIRRYSWSIISTTVSIFTSVLIFHGIEEALMVVLGLEDVDSPYLMLLVNYTFFLVWFS